MSVTEDIAPGKTLRVELDGRAGQCLRVSFEVDGKRDIDFFSAVVGDGEPLMRPMRRARSLAEDTTCEPLLSRRRPHGAEESDAPTS